MFDQQNILDSGFYHFRVIVEVIISDIDTGESHPERAYYTTFGVTAASAAAAVETIEAELDGAMIHDIVSELTITTLHPDEIPKDVVDISSLQEPGIHFVSGRIYFDPDQED